jgi:hypothetical protein
MIPFPGKQYMEQIVTRQGLAQDLHEHLAGVERVRLALRRVQGDRPGEDEWVMGAAYG